MHMSVGERPEVDHGCGSFGTVHFIYFFKDLVTSIFIICI